MFNSKNIVLAGLVAFVLAIIFTPSKTQGYISPGGWTMYEVDYPLWWTTFFMIGVVTAALVYVSRLK